jgi:hypothetical protein
VIEHNNFAEFTAFSNILHVDFIPTFDVHVTDLLHILRLEVLKKQCPDRLDTAQRLNTHIERARLGIQKLVAHMMYKDTPLCWPGDQYRIGG